MTAALLHLLISYMPPSGDLCHFMRSLYAGTAFPAWYPGTEVSPRGIYLHEYFLSSLHTKKETVCGWRCCRDLGDRELLPNNGCPCAVHWILL